MARVLLTRRIPSSALDRLERRHTVEVFGGGDPIPHAELLARISDADALICLLTDRIGADVIAAAPRLKIVANVAVGYDNVDLAAARARHIAVTNTPDVLTEAVAEFTWALILGIARRLVEGDRVVRSGAWKGWALDFMLGMELRGKQLGIVGAGRIGRAVAARAPAFGMSAACAGKDMPLDQLLVTSDVVSIHTPATPQTHHLINRKTLARMKRSAVLVNTSRGSVVDEAALAWALGERLIAGAALDVYEREPAVHPALLVRDDVLLAPHIGSATRETRTAMADLAVRNVINVLAGQSPLTPVG